MKNRVLILLAALCSLISAESVFGQHDSATANRVVNIAGQTDTGTGYHGPVTLGPFSINNREGGTQFRKLLSEIGQSAVPTGAYVCFYDSANSIYLVVERGADDPRLVRGLTLSRIDVCPVEHISKASGFSTWATESGIRLGSSMTAVASQYGEPSQIDELRTDPEFYLSPYPLEKRASDLPKDGRILSYLPKEGAPSTNHASLGIRGGVVVWITVSDNE